MKLKILHTEASAGWGGQELRILSEAEGMRQRGYELLFGVQVGGSLVELLRAAHFQVVELDFSKRAALQTVWTLYRLMKQERVSLVNTHSSMDAWMGGCAARLASLPVIRTRHVSTQVRGGVNGSLLYRGLADCVVTTCEDAALHLQKLIGLSKERCLSIPTGVSEELKEMPREAQQLRLQWGVQPGELLVGTLSVLRHWKGIDDFLRAAKLLEKEEGIRWVVIGEGVSRDHYMREHAALGLGERVVFAGHLYPPTAALTALDLFVLLSWMHEGVSQSALQAALLGKPLVTTPTGGLKEVCLDRETGLLVPKHNPEAVAAAILQLRDSSALREKLGRGGRALVQSRFTQTQMLDRMEEVYCSLVASFSKR